RTRVVGWRQARCWRPRPRRARRGRAGWGSPAPGRPAGPIPPLRRRRPPPSGGGRSGGGAAPSVRASRIVVPGGAAVPPAALRLAAVPAWYGEDMRLDRFTERSQEALQAAQTAATSLQHPTVLPE